MKNVITVLPVLFICLLRAVLGLGGTPVPSAAENFIAPSGEEPVYRLDTMTAENIFSAEDGKEVARYSYQLLTLSAENLSSLSPADAELVRRNVDNFNDKMISLMDDSVETGKQMGEDALAIYGETGGDPSYFDETAASARLAGQMVSVRIDHASYAGGAHPNTNTFGCLFDLQIGQFIDPAQIAEKPEDFRAGAAALLLEKAEALEEYRPFYWSDYADIIAAWNEGTVLFDDEGMLVIFSPYGLGPYSMGEVELRLSCAELAELAGCGALARLGMELPSGESNGT